MENNENGPLNLYKKNESSIYFPFTFPINKP